MSFDLLRAPQFLRPEQTQLVGEGSLAPGDGEHAIAQFGARPFNRRRRRGSRTDGFGADALALARLRERQLVGFAEQFLRPLAVERPRGVSDFYFGARLRERLYELRRI